MDYTFNQETVLARLGVETLKVQAAEERLTVVDAALSITCGTNPAEFPEEVCKAALAEIQRRNQAKNVLVPLPSDADTEDSVEGKGDDASEASGGSSSS